MSRAMWAWAWAVLLVACLGGPPASAGTADGGTQRWSASFRLGAPAYSTANAISPDGRTVVVTGTTAFGPSGRIATLAYDASSGDERWLAGAPDGYGDDWSRGSAVTMSPDGSTVFVTASHECSACSSREGWLTIAYDVENGDVSWSARRAAEGGPSSIAVSPDGSGLFVSGQESSGEARALVAYDPRTGQRLWGVRRDGPPTAWSGLQVSPDGRTVYLAGSRLTPEGVPDPCTFDRAGLALTAYDVRDGGVRWSADHKIAEHYLCGVATGLALSPDGSRVYVFGYGGSTPGRFAAGAAAYDTATGSKVWSLREDAVHVLSGDTRIDLEVSPDGASVYLLGSGCDDSCRTNEPFVTASYDATDGARRWLSRYDGGGRGFSGDLEVSPDGASLYATGQMNMPCYAACLFSQTVAPLVSYDAASGDVRWASTFEDNTASALAVSPDSSSVYLAGTFTASADSSSARTATARGAAARTCDSGTCGYSAAGYNVGSGPARIDDSEARPTIGRWRTFFDNDAVGASYRASAEAGDTVRFTTPRSTYVDWLTHVGPDQGKARVVLDGRSQGVFDLYAPEATSRVVRFDGLEREVHRVKVVVLGRADPASNGTWAAIDGFGVRAGSGIHHESDPQIRYDEWRGVDKSVANGGSFRRSSSPAASISLAFRGRSLRWITATGPRFGRAGVVIDGRRHVVDLYRRERSWRVPITFDGLARGSHEVSISPSGTKRAASRGTAVVVDGFVVRR